MTATAGRNELNAELLRRASDEHASPESARAAGRALADLYMSHGNLYDAPLALLTEDAYAGFDDRVAEIQGEAVEIVSHEVELA